MADYAVRHVPDHPKASASGCVYEHVLIAERALGRYLPEGAEVHHADENKRNNANRNLVICQDKAYHKLLHARARVVAAGGDPNTQAVCGACRQPKPFSAFYRMADNASTGVNGRCKECHRLLRKPRARRMAA